jgi:hypothetical protein
MPLRILVFFCALVPMASVFVYRLTRLKTGVFEAVGAHALPYTLTLVGVIGGLLIGWALGIPLASIAGDAGDARYGMVAGALVVSILLLAIHHKLVARALERLPVPAPSRRVVSLARDPRLYLNAIRGIVQQMRDTGLDARCEVSEYDSAVEMRLVLPKGGKNGGTKNQ